MELDKFLEKKTPKEIKETNTERTEITTEEIKQEKEEEIDTNSRQAQDNNVNENN